MKLIPVAENYQCVVLTKAEAHSLLKDLIGQLADDTSSGSQAYFLNGDEVSEQKKRISFIIK